MTTIQCPRCKGKGRLRKSPYKKGANYEYTVMSKLRAKGYEVFRAYASRGVYDLIATKGMITHGVQVKTLSQTNKAYLTPKDRLSLNKQLDFEDEYVLLRWDMVKHAAVEKTFSNPKHILHAYKDGSVTKWKELIEVDTWVDFKP
jgi:Holliday junction resolvase